jgi:hypothetical protein
MPPRTTRRSAHHKRKIIWNAYTTPKRHVKSALVWYFSPLITVKLQIARAKAIKEEFVKKVQHQAAEGRKIADVLADGVITGVGLIQRDGDTGSKAK